MIAGLTVALIGSLVVNWMLYKSNGRIKERHRDIIDGLFVKMQDITRELSRLQGETEGVKNTQELIREAMGVLGKSAVELPKRTSRRRKKEASE